MTHHTQRYLTQAVMTAATLALPAALAYADPLVPNPHDLVTEHVDLNFVYSGGSFTIQPRDDDNGGVSYAANHALLHVDQISKVTSPGGSYTFTGAQAGESLYVLTQPQTAGLLYLGYAGYGVSSGTFDRYDPSAESGGRATTTQEWLKASLTSVKGPGAFSLWQNSGVASEPTVFMSTANGGITSSDAMWITAGGHIHYSFGFTKAGLYQVNLLPSAYKNGTLVQASEPVSLYFNVDPGYAKSRNVAASEFTNLGHAALNTTGYAEVVTAQSVQGAITVHDVDATHPLWVLLDLKDPTLVGALTVALSGFDPDKDGYHEGLNGYDLLDVKAEATIDNSILSGYSGYDLALRFDTPLGQQFDFEFDYSAILDGLQIDRVGFVGTQAAVPEAASLGLLAVGALSLLRRKRA